VHILLGEELDEVDMKPVRVWKGILFDQVSIEREVVQVLDGDRIRVSLG